MRSDYLQVTVLFLDLAEELLETVAESGTLGEPQRQTGANVGREGEEFHFLAELAVVTLLGLLEEHQVLVEHLLLGEGDAVYAHQLVALLVAAPVCAGKRGDLHGLDCTGVGEVRAAAQVGEAALCVGGDVAVLKFGYELALVVLVAVAEHFEGVTLGDVLADDGFLALSQLEHFLLDLGEVLGCELVFTGVDIVVETVLNGRADAELHAGIELLESLGEEVGRRVPESVLAFGVIPFEQLDFGVRVDGAREVPFLVIDRGSEHVLREAGAD